MTPIYAIWHGFTQEQPETLKKACTELLEFERTGLVPQDGLLQAFAARLRDEGYPGYQSIAMACETVRHFAVELVASLEHGEAVKT